MRRDSQYYKIIKFFKTKIKQEFQVRRCKMKKGYEGDCRYIEGVYYIRIERTLNESAAISVLLHEVSHISSLFKEKDPHGVSFGTRYSEIYKMYEGEFCT